MKTREKRNKNGTNENACQGAAVSYLIGLRVQSLHIDVEFEWWQERTSFSRDSRAALAVLGFFCRKKKNRSIRINWPTSCLVIIRQSASRPTCSPVYMCVRAMNVEQVAVVFYLEASHSRSTPLFLISSAHWNWVDSVLYEPVSVGFISMVMACRMLRKRLCSANNAIARVDGVINGSRYFRCFFFKLKYL